MEQQISPITDITTAVQSYRCPRPFNRFDGEHNMNRHVPVMLMLGFLIALGPIAAAGQEAAPHAAQQQITQPPQDAGYLLGPSDVVHIEALNHPDFNVKTPVGQDGTIQLPYLGTVSVSNMTVSAMRNKIAGELMRRGIFSNLSLEADVASYGSRYATVLGGVVTPGLIPLDREYRLSEILARVGGIRDGSSNYVILRSPGGRERQFSIRDLSVADIASDPIVRPGDKVYVPTEVFYIKGQIKSPGTYPLSLSTTLAMALARGGGLTDFGSDSHITIIRKNTKLQPEDLNFKVMSDDVIEVGEGWF
jgi:polysaccharide export outer membrane protein